MSSFQPHCSDFISGWSWSSWWSHILSFHDLTIWQQKSVIYTNNHPNDSKLFLILLSHKDESPLPGSVLEQSLWQSRILRDRKLLPFTIAHIITILQLLRWQTLSVPLRHQLRHLASRTGRTWTAKPQINLWTWNGFCGGNIWLITRGSQQTSLCLWMQHLFIFGINTNETEMGASAGTGEPVTGGYCAVASKVPSDCRKKRRAPHWERERFFLYKKKTNYYQILFWNEQLWTSGAENTNPTDRNHPFIYEEHLIPLLESH